MQVCLFVYWIIDVIYMTCGLFLILHHVLCVLAFDPGTSTECIETWILSESGRYNHIATSHGPMVQGGLLTAHTGGVHGYGWSPGGDSSFRQGARAASPGSPDLETVAAAEQRGIREKGFMFRGFHPDR